eukprot:3686002-Rhodomonas_salina.2
MWLVLSRGWVHEGCMYWSSKANVDTHLRAEEVLSGNKYLWEEIIRDASTQECAKCKELGASINYGNRYFHLRCAHKAGFTLEKTDLGHRSLLKKDATDHEDDDAQLRKRRLAVPTEGAGRTKRKKTDEKDAGTKQLELCLQTELCLDFLMCIAYVAHVQMETRDFEVCAETLKRVETLWCVELLHPKEEMQRAMDVLLEGSVVGVLSMLSGDATSVEPVKKVLRFSHLTFQEYLAARYVVSTQRSSNVYSKLAGSGLPDWIRGVVCFAAMCLPKRMGEGGEGQDSDFLEFAQDVIRHEDGTSACCELIRGCMEERGHDQSVKDLIANKYWEIRQVDQIVLGLCHPSPDVRNKTLSELELGNVGPTFAHDSYRRIVDNTLSVACRNDRP